MTLTIEQKTGKILSYWEKVISNTNPSTFHQDETFKKCLNELKNPQIPEEILTIWLKIFLKSIKNPKIPENIKNHIIKQIYTTNWFIPNSVQNKILKNLFFFFQNIILINNNFIILTIKNALDNLVSYDLKFSKKEEMKNYKDFSYIWKDGFFKSFGEIEKIVDDIVDDCRDLLVLSNDLMVEIKVF